MTDMSMKSPFAFRSEIHHIDEIIDRSEVGDSHSIRERYVVVRPVIPRSTLGQISNITEQNSVHESQHIPYRYSRAVVGDIPPLTKKNDNTYTKPKYNSRLNTDQSYIEQYRKRKEIERKHVEEKEPIIVQRLNRPKTRPVQQLNDIEDNSNRNMQPARQYTQQNVPQTPKSSSSQISESGHSLNDSPPSKFSIIHHHGEVNSDENREEEEDLPQESTTNSLDFNGLESGRQEDELLEEESFSEKQNQDQNIESNNTYEEDYILKSDTDIERTDEGKNINDNQNQHQNVKIQSQSYQQDYMNSTQPTKSYTNTSRVVIHQKERSTIIFEPDESELEKSKSYLNETTSKLSSSKLKPFQRPPIKSNTSKMSATGMREFEQSRSTMETPTRPIRYSQDMVGNSTQRVKPQHVSFVEQTDQNISENTLPTENKKPEKVTDEEKMTDISDKGVEDVLVKEKVEEKPKKSTPKRRMRGIPIRSKSHGPKLITAATQIDLESDKETIIFDPDEPMPDELGVTREEFIEFGVGTAGPMTPSELEESDNSFSSSETETPKGSYMKTEASKRNSNIKSITAAQTMKPPARKMSPEQFSNAHRFEPGYLASIANGEGERGQPSTKSPALKAKVTVERKPAIVDDSDVIVFRNPRAGLGNVFKRRANAGDEEEWRQTATEVKLANTRADQDQSPIKIAPARADTSLAEFLETEARMAQSPEKSTGLGFVALDDRPTKTRKFRPPPRPERRRHVEPNYPKVLNIIRARVGPGPEFKAANSACAAVKGEHLAVLVSFPLLAVEGVYRLDQNERQLLKVWGYGPESIEEEEVSRFFHYNTASRDFDEVPYSKFDQNIEVISIE